MPQIFRFVYVIIIRFMLAFVALKNVIITDKSSSYRQNYISQKIQLVEAPQRRFNFNVFLHFRQLIGVLCPQPMNLPLDIFNADVPPSSHQLASNCVQCVQPLAFILVVAVKARIQNRMPFIQLY